MQHKLLRRGNKELDNETTLGILNNAQYGTLALCDSQGPYAVPINYVFVGGEIFFHGAKQGHKIDCINNTSNACFSVVGQNELESEFTTKYQSVCASGKIEFVEDKEEKIEALMLLCKKYYEYEQDHIMKYIETFIERTCVFKMVCEYIVGKGVPFK